MVCKVVKFYLIILSLIKRYMQKFIRQYCLLLVFISCCVCAHAQSVSKQNDTAYIRAINERAAKIIEKLDIRESLTSRQVQQMVAQQYFDLNNIDTRRDDEIKTVKSSHLDKSTTQDSINAIRLRAEAQTATLHASYIAKLQSVLTPLQVDAVKDGMTYGVLKLTYNAYLQMLPDLTQEQKNQIMTWLVEAREHAMDGGTSKEKHAWFGKYKGRINNYLAKAGIDMKAAEKDWMKKSNNAQLSK